MTRDNTSTAANALVVQLRVLHALILRDIRTRFFGNGLGYIVAILWPLVHIFVLLAVFHFTGRVSPIGNTIVFLAVSVVPVLCFLYMSRFIMFSVISNSPLLAFPIVHLIDIIAARVVLEISAAFCVVAVVSLSLLALGYPVYPDNPSQAFVAFLGVIFCGIGLGVLNGIIASKLPGWVLAYVVQWIFIYTTSGIVIQPDIIPSFILDIFSWNPTLHVVEWIRESYFYGYKSVVLDKFYPFEFGVVALFAALFFERTFRRFLRR